jgi:hypothetical protein
MVKPSRVVEGGRAGLRTMTMDNTNDEQRELSYVMQISGSNSQAEAEELLDGSEAMTTSRVNGHQNHGLRKSWKHLRRHDAIW